MLRDFDLWQLVYVAASSTLAGFVGGVSGMGGGLIVAAAAAPIFGVKAVIPLMSVYMVVNNLSRMYFFRTGLDRRAVCSVLLGSIPAIAVGVLVFKRMDSAWVSIIMGTSIFLSVPFRRYAGQARVVLSGSGLVMAGGVAGILGTVTVGVGTLIIPVLLGAGLQGAALIASRSAVGLGLGMLKTAGFAASGSLGWPLVSAGVLMGLCAFPGVACAAWIVRHTKLRIHTIVIEVALVLCAGLFIWDGLSRVMAD